MKKVVISCGPIPARLDSVKYITNRFKGGLAFKTAQYLMDKGFDVTIVKWIHTPLPDECAAASVQNINDVLEYYHWFESNAAHYDAFVMAAAVANLTPSNPYPYKFPSHLYNVGEHFNITFEIAPRAIDVIKKVNPRACLIGYKLYDAPSDYELIGAAHRTLEDSRANIIFANTPNDAKERKLALFADNTVLPCTFDEHLKLIVRAINQEYYQTFISAFGDLLTPEVRHAMAITKMFEQTFRGFGTVAVPVDAKRFVTTSRGHKEGPVLVADVDDETRLVTTSGKATLNAPLLAALVRLYEGKAIIVHRHEDDPRYNQHRPFDESINTYLFPGTIEEVQTVLMHCANHDKKLPMRIKLKGHGDISILPIKEVDWTTYYDTFPERYFGTSERMQKIIDENLAEDAETLELGANRLSPAKYVYDPFVKAVNAENISWDDVCNKKFDFVFIRNAINYMTKDEIRTVLSRTDKFVANTFREAPLERVSDREAAISDGKRVFHALLNDDDSITVHSFNAYKVVDYTEMGLCVSGYGHNSCLLTKGV